MDSRPERREQDWKEVLGQRLAAFVEAYEQGSLDGIRDVFWQDDDILFIGTQANLHFVGWPQVEHSFRRQFQNLSGLRITLRAPPVCHGGAPPSTFACLTVPSLDLELTAGGRAAVHTGIRLTCAFEQRAGIWRMVQMHWSVARPQVVVDHD